MAKLIPLTQGKFAVVDDADFEWLSGWKWHTVRKGRTHRAARNIRVKGKAEIVYMHRMILNPPPGMESDHVNGDGFDNRRANLRVCTHTQNCQNRPKRRGCSSKYTGVCWDKYHHKWRSRICVKGRLKHLGYFSDEKKAAVAYNIAASKHFGDFARPNQVG